jgi:hypothetical protein
MKLLIQALFHIPRANILEMQGCNRAMQTQKILSAFPDLIYQDLCCLAMLQIE